MSIQVETSVKNWLWHIVIGYNFCPFAKREWIRDAIAYPQSTASTINEALTDLQLAIESLESDPRLETSLLILNAGFRELDDYLDLVDCANLLLDNSGYRGIYQIASFHPNYLFEGEAADDASHYTNRAPYPILHLIREAGLQRAVENHPNPEQIPLDNIDKARELGTEHWQKLLAQCLSSKVSNKD